ncbi:MAG: hypothetical protein LBE12_13000 [Planctomycetaceae bacterium]|jgi:hypothetical protein|nr:hypothetical protein [Planctomycetaceae bacterium]
MKFFHLILLPFDLLGQVIFIAGIFLWKVIGQFFLSPWGLIVPLTLLSVLFLFSQLTQTSRQIAESYAKELEFCEESKIPELVGRFVRLGEYGIPALVQGLSSSREPVFLACRNTLQHEMEQWEQLPASERLRYYRFFSAALLDKATQFGTTAQAEAQLFAQQILRNLVVSPKGESPDSRLVTRNCEQLLALIETPPTKPLLSGTGNSVIPIDSVVPADTSSEKTARFSRGGIGTALMTAQGRPFRSEISEELQQGTDIAGQESGDMFAVSRAERLYAYHQSPLFQKQFGTSSQHFEPQSLPGRIFTNPMFPGQEVPDREGLGDDSMEMLASMTSSRFSGSSLVIAKSPEILYAKPENKVAGNIRLPEKQEKEISRNIPEKRDSTQYLAAASEFLEDSEQLLPWELREITLEKIPNLSSVRLMRLLHHPDERYVSEARRTLIVRDGFQDNHLRLAYRLYHPVASVRMEIISMLPNTHGVRSEVWLSALLADSDNEIRYRAASFLATANDPALQRLVIDKGKRDPDTRIVNLADQLLQQQRHRVRR